MFLYLENHVRIPVQSVIALLSYQHDKDEDQKPYLLAAQKKGTLQHLTHEPETIVITTSQIYISGLNLRSVTKRFVNSSYHHITQKLL